MSPNVVEKLCARAAALNAPERAAAIAPPETKAPPAARSWPAGSPPPKRAH